jgi:FkbM family methyltransferase
MIEKIKRIYRYYFKSQPKFKIIHKTKVERHGSVYGGWNIIPNTLHKGSVVYSFGIGEDISFDLSIIQKYGCQIHGFDPTPRVADFLAKQNTPSNFIFYPIGLSDNDGTLTFYTPENEAHISHKAFASESSRAVEVKCNKISTIMVDLKHQHIDLLKIDIEGFEYQVLENIFQEKIPIHQLLVEFHHFFPEIGNEKTEKMIQQLEEKGFRLFNVSDSFCEYSFINQAKLNHGI